MKSHRSKPIALTIAGSDSGGGAGLQADLQVFSQFGVHGTTAITCLTAQNPRGVRAIRAATPQFVRQQLDAILAELPPAAAKTGMLYSAAIIRAVVAFFRRHREIPLVVDPVMVATSGARLLKPAAEKVLLQQLLPLATLVTPNLDEAAILTGQQLHQPEDLRRAARHIHHTFGCAALVKGGHLRTAGGQAIDIFYDGTTELLLSAPFVSGVSTHGTGCTYSAAITARLAAGDSLSDAVYAAKNHVTGAIAHSQRAGRHFVLNHRWNQRRPQ